MTGVSVRKKREFFVSLKEGDISITEDVAGKKRELYLYQMFLLIFWQNAESEKCSHVFYQNGRKPIFDGEPLQSLHFVNSDVQMVEADSVEEHISLNVILRLSFFAMTDKGAILISFYPSLSAFARQLIMFSSHKPLAVALAQHFSASWMLEIYKK